MYKEEIIVGKGGNSIYTASSSAERNLAKIVIVHGLHDHCGRYEHVADYFTERGLSTIRFDFRGFGRSEGLQGYINRFSDYVDDLSATIDHYTKEDDVPWFLYGHSMGALVSAHYILSHSSRFGGVIFSDGLFKVNEDISPILQKMSGLISVVFPKLKTIKLDQSALYQDAITAANKVNDPLHYTGGVRARTGAEMIAATAEIQAQLNKLTFPMLILHGGADTLTKPEASKLLYAESTSSDKTLKIYPGAFHELFNEPIKEEVFDDMYTWIEARL